AVLVCDVERVKGAEGSDFQSRNAVIAVVDRARRAGEMKNEIALAHIERFANVFLNEFEARLVAEVGDVGAATGEQVVDDDHTPAFGEQGIAEMRTQKAGAPSD